MLGRGAFGIVYGGQHHFTGEQWALKVASDAIHPQSLSNVDTEMRNVAALVRAGVDSSAMMTVEDEHEVRDDADSLVVRALVMRVAEGGDLFSYVLRRNGLGEDGARPLFRKVCDVCFFLYCVLCDGYK